MHPPGNESSPNGLSSADAEAIRDAKSLLREAVLLRRETRPDELRNAMDSDRFDYLRQALSFRVHKLRTVAAYLSTAPEPDTLRLVAWLAAHEIRVLLPVLSPLPDGTRRPAPDWAAYGGPDQLQVGLNSILEPTTETLGPDAIGEAELIFCPGLAANEAGDRLGRGAAWYDRALKMADPHTETWLLLNDDEVMEAIPTEPWDRTVAKIATPTRLIVCKPDA